MTTPTDDLDALLERLEDRGQPISHEECCRIAEHVRTLRAENARLRSDLARSEAEVERLRNALSSWNDHLRCCSALDEDGCTVARARCDCGYDAARAHDAPEREGGGE